MSDEKVREALSMERRAWTRWHQSGGADGEVNRLIQETNEALRELADGQMEVERERD